MLFAFLSSLLVFNLPPIFAFFEIVIPNGIVEDIVDKIAGSVDDAVDDIIDIGFEMAAKEAGKRGHGRFSFHAMGGLAAALRLVVADL